MKKYKAINQKPAKSNRPMGVWALTFYSFIYTGVLPFLIAINSLLTNDTETSIFSIIFSITLSLFLILLSFGTWQGKNIARKLLLITLSLYYVLLGMNNYNLVNSGLFSVDEVNKLWGQVILGVVILVVSWIYFNLRGIKEFYKPNANMLDDE